MAWQYNTGCPFTAFVPYGPEDSRLTMGELNSSRYPPYHRLDLGIHRHFETNKGRITAFLEVINVYNRKNVAYYNYTINVSPDDPSQRSISRKPAHWFPFLPSVGVNWSWGE